MLPFQNNWTSVSHAGRIKLKPGLHSKPRDLYIPSHLAERVLELRIRVLDLGSCHAMRSLASHLSCLCSVPSPIMFCFNYLGYKLFGQGIPFPCLK